MVNNLSAKRLINKIVDIHFKPRAEASLCIQGLSGFPYLLVNQTLGRQAGGSRPYLR